MSTDSDPDPVQIYVRQDGADFYVYSDPKGKRFIRHCSAPLHIKDWDLDAAEKARKWFMDYGYFKKGKDAIFLGCL